MTLTSTSSFLASLGDLGREARAILERHEVVGREDGEDGDGDGDGAVLPHLTEKDVRSFASKLL